MNFARTKLTLVRTFSVSSNARTGAGSDQSRAKEYNRVKQRIMLIGLAISMIGGAIFAVSGLPMRLSERVDRFSPNKWVRRSIFAGIVTVGELLIGLPLGYFSGFVLEHRYGLSNQSRSQWFIEQLKGLAVSLPFAALGTNLILEIIGRWPKRWWAIATSLALPFTVLLSQLSPVLLMPIFNKFEPLKDTELADRLKNLARESGINVASVMQMDMSRQTNKANAFFAGMGRTRRIVLADTMLDRFSSKEIEVVVAHEIAHQAHRDLWWMIGLGTVFTAGISWSVDLVAKRIVSQFGDRFELRSISHVSALPLLSWLLAVVAFALAPLQNLMSRIIERRADTYALRLTNDPKSFESAMSLLGEMNLDDPKPSAFVKYTMYSHPPIAERIARARRFARGEG